MSHLFSNIIIEIEEGSDGLFGIKVIDTSNGVTWWETVCETQEDALKTVQSLFENKAMLDLQEKLNRVKVNK